jgi:hypothetical protein
MDRCGAGRIAAGKGSQLIGPARQPHLGGHHQDVLEWDRQRITQLVTMYSTSAKAFVIRQIVSQFSRIERGYYPSFSSSTAVISLHHLVKTS